MWPQIALFVGATLAATFVLVVGANLLLRQRDIDYEFSCLPDADEESFSRCLAGLAPGAFSMGNRVGLLQNGEEAFPAMLEAIKQAQRTITFENYIYWSGEIGRQFADLLASRSQDGVSVRVHLDWLGSHKMDRRLREQLSSAGVDLHYYHPLQLGLLSELNHRTHRRILVVDGRIAFTGGVAFADPWTGSGDAPGQRRDNHYAIEGPAVADLQSTFGDNWLKTSGEILAGDDYYPPLDRCGETQLGIVRSTPKERITLARLITLALIGAARETIRIEQAYFVPDAYLTEALSSAAQRGVDVEILLPGDQIDYAVVRRASRARWGPLLESGVKIYEYQPAMLHAKTMLIDDLWLLAGSANFDYRSLYRNDEICLLARDASFAALHAESFREDRRRSERITHEAWQQRPRRQKLLDHAAALFRTQL